MLQHNAMGLQEALAECNTFISEDEIPWSKIAQKHGVVRSTLTRTWRGETRSREEQAIAQQKLTPQQEEELVQYIEELTARHIPPTREMIANFASAVAQEPVSESWVTRFISKYSIHLISHYSTGMDSNRHNADSYTKYELYFNLLQRKIAEYKVDAEHTYNMDEKGFMIGITTRAKHVFSRRMWEKGEVKASLQDGNRAWITLLACVCGDGSALPPSLIYESANSTIQSSWVEEIQSGEHSVLVSSSPSGWTNNDIGLAWLEQVFDRFTKEKARRKYRLLILDGHGSHVTMDFINYCDQNKILLAIFPPHSTHTLQPLDVVMFKPLSTAYSKELTTHLHNGQGLSVIKKSDFFHLFWKAWVSTFTQGLILRSFEATGISPLQPSVILQRFAKDTPEASDGSTSSSSVYSGKDWLKIETLLRKVVRDETSKELRKISRSLHHISVQNQLLHHENQGLKEALKTQKKHKNKSKALQFQPRKEYHGGAEFYSPSRVEKARLDEKTKQENQKAEELQKAEMAKLRHANKLYNEKIAQEKREQRVREKEERERVRAEKAKEAAKRKAQREHDKQARNAKKAIQLPQKGKRKALTAPAAKISKKRRVGAAQSRAVAASPPLPPRTHTTRSGRTATLYK
jgi:hypothetical protein